MTLLKVAYDAELLKWRLGKDHPTNPVRAKKSVELLWDRLPGLVDVQPITRRARHAELALVHASAYVDATLLGLNDEWKGKRPDLGVVARHMFAGTMQLVDQVLDGTLRYGFAPQGAKHHAMRDYGSGFCVFNDFAAAALRLAEAGHRVLVIDTDAHHGDGTEELTRDCRDVMTLSFHDSTIFPGTGDKSEPTNGVFNWPLDEGAGDRDLMVALYEALPWAEEFDPTIVLWALGGDGYVDDPLSSLQYTYAGYEAVAAAIGAFVGLRDVPLLMGGAGGYLPLTHTPRVWATCVEGALSMAERVRQYDVHDVESVV